MEKLEWSDGEKGLWICVIVLAEYRRVIDGQTAEQTGGRTDGQISCHGIVRTRAYMHTRRAVKMERTIAKSNGTHTL